MPRQKQPKTIIRHSNCSLLQIHPWLKRTDIRKHLHQVCVSSSKSWLYFKKNIVKRTRRPIMFIVGIPFKHLDIVKRSRSTMTSHILNVFGNIVIYIDHMADTWHTTCGSTYRLIWHTPRYCKFTLLSSHPWFIFWKGGVLYVSAIHISFM